MTTYHPHTDEHLFSLLQNDDEKAFTELYERYWKKLLIRAGFLLSSNEDAEELIHDVFVTLWEKRYSIRIIHTFHTYITAMVQYGTLKILAKRKSQHIKRVADDLTDVADYSTQHWLDFDNLREELEAAVSQLPEKCQLVFRLSREQGLSDKQIAEKLDVSVNTIRTQIYRALHKLKDTINFFFCI